MSQQLAFSFPCNVCNQTADLICELCKNSYCFACRSQKIRFVNTYERAQSNSFADQAIHALIYGIAQDENICIRCARIM